MLRMNLFTYRDLKAWLDAPFDIPPEIPEPDQLTFRLPGFGQPTAQAKTQTSTQNPAVSTAHAL